MPTYFIRRQIDRRDWGARQALARLVQEAFLTIPGISLTAPQASRFFGVGEDACARILEDLQEEGVQALCTNIRTDPHALTAAMRGRCLGAASTDPRKP